MYLVQGQKNARHILLGITTTTITKPDGAKYYIYQLGVLVGGVSEGFPPDPYLGKRKNLLATPIFGHLLTTTSNGLT